VVVSLILVVLVPGIFAACGDGEEKDIRTQQGLGVGLAALSARERSEAAQAGQADSGALAPSETGREATDRSVSFGSAAVQQSQTGITVPGFGSATADADSAVLELYFGRYSTPIPADGQTRPDSETQTTVAGAPITEADLAPVIDALVAAGVAREDVEFLGTPYYDPYAASATLRATVRNIGIVGAVVQAATNAAAGLADIVLQSTYVSYTVGDCAALERAAMDAAVADARERATAFAAVLGVGLGDIACAADYAWSPFGGSPCDVGYLGPVPLGGAVYSEGQPSQVQVYANVTITYEIR
jgi:uncharacterized protein YggE